MAMAKGLDDGVCWVCGFLCRLNNPQGIHHRLLVPRISTFILQAFFSLPSHNLLDAFIFQTPSLVRSRKRLH